MTQNLQVSKKLDDGTILVVGGATVPDFETNLRQLGGESFAAEIRSAFLLLMPIDEQQATQNVQNTFPQARPVQLPVQQQESWGNPPVPAYQPRRDNPQPQPGQGGQQAAMSCPSHGQPAVWKDGTSKAGNKYAFWTCPVNDSVISNYQGPGLKSSCPAPKQR